IPAGETFAFHCGAQPIGNANTGGACSEHDDLLFLQILSGHVDRTQNCSQCNGRRPLDVVVESQQFIAVALKKRPGMRSGEVFPLQTCSGKFLLHGPDELIDKIKIRLTGNPFVAPAEVLMIAEPFRIVGSHIQQDGQSPFGTNPTDERIQGKLADRNAHSSHALITDAQNTFAVGDDNYVNVRIGTISQDRRNRITQRVRDEQAARSPVDVTELFAREPDHRRVHYGGHFFNVVEQKPVEKDFVSVLQRAQVDMPLQVVVLSLVSLVGADYLLLDALDMRRQKSVQTESSAFLLRECRAFVQLVAIEKIHSAGDARYNRLCYL